MMKVEKKSKENHLGDDLPRTRHNACTADYYHKDYVAKPAGKSKSEKNVTEKLRFFRRIQRSRNIAGSNLSVNLRRENNTDYSQWETADGG
jgi:hypothetical protein